jgi:diguanylate cyclase (GGDEF)-like protein
MGLGWRWPRVGWLTVLSLLASLGFCALSGAVILDIRRETWARAAEAASNLNRAVGHDIARTVATLDLSLQAVVTRLRHPGVAKLDPELRNFVLFDNVAAAQHFGPLVVLDATGEIVMDAASIEPRRGNFADRDYFQVHRDRSDAGLHVSLPFFGRLTGEWLVGISRRLSHPDGSFAGVALGTLKLDHFRRLFGELALGPGGRITLLRDDGIVLMRAPDRPEIVGRDFSGGTAFRAISRAQEGQYRRISSRDGVDRLFAFRRIADLPLILNVGLGVDDIEAGWLRRAAAIGGTTLILTGALVAGTLLLHREVASRRAKEAELARLVRLDALTGLANRRAFDEALGREWSRCALARTPVSLLLVDVDRFKALNDRYGHQAGDECLRVVAATVGATIRHSSDLVARYGGEEFAVLLPDTDAAGAEEAAERLRAEIQALGMPHEGCGVPGAVVTVSVGVATARPVQPGVLPGPGSLIGAADHALYEAKRGGRNRVVQATPPSERHRRRLGRLPVEGRHIGGTALPLAFHAGAVSAGSADSSDR